MDVSILIPALLVAIFCYFGAIESPWLFGKTGGFYVMGRPLVAGLLTGIAFGDVRAGILCGIAVQILYIAHMPVDNEEVGDISYASYGGIALSVATGGYTWVAVIMSLIIGKVFGTVFSSRRLAWGALYNKKMDEAVSDIDLKKIVRNHVLIPQIAIFLFRTVPIFLIVLFGAPALNVLIDISPDVFMDFLMLTGNLLPAIGIGMLMYLLIREIKQIVLFFIGFILVAFFNMNTTLVFLNTLLAMLAIYYLKGSKEPDDVKASDDMLDDSNISAIDNKLDMDLIDEEKDV